MSDTPLFDGISEFETTKLKRCKTCGQAKSLRDFPRTKTCDDGVRPHCRECMPQVGNKNLMAKKNADVPEDHRRCTACKKIKPIGEYRRSRISHGGRETRCRDCGKAYQNKYAKKNRARNIQLIAEQLTKPGFYWKQCNRCELFKQVADFTPVPWRPDGLHYFCKDCCNEKAKLYSASRINHFKGASRIGAKKKCGECGETKALDQFQKQSTCKFGVSPYCRPCLKLRSYKSYLMREYGMTLEEYLAMKDAQGGVCAICRQPGPDHMRLCVDHSHVTGATRQLLCHFCNVALGAFDDNISVLESAIAYLKKHQAE